MVLTMAQANRCVDYQRLGAAFVRAAFESTVVWKRIDHLVTAGGYVEKAHMFCGEKKTKAELLRIGKLIDTELEYLIDLPLNKYIPAER